ncbi:hypothetical protein [Tautonia plasticadhaerens]|uniref:Uncharacterized protein n=1 Tax=Tautonia plasticadhaerens TaxID=2527974 RepID=A0A518H812_9BACT|nr:hypothetical protein [Tautonia plasticadhaerens]QDV36931.1 hypothetical protein ElP_48610 [Tautonia plasticadhaerens]
MPSEKTRNRRVRDPICSFLKSLISPYGFGWAKPGGVDRYTNDQMIGQYNRLGFMGSPNNSDLYAHFAGQTTFYFWADGRKTTPRTLSLIDIDCHGRGTAASARAFAEWLEDNGFPALYHEPSTHGKGRHGYFILDKEGLDDVAVANLLKRLDKVLKTLLRLFLATHPEHDIEDVEIKGTPHILTWAKGEGRQIERMKSGQLAKLPRDILDRFEEFRDTTVLSIQKIYELEDRAERIVIPGPRKLSVFRLKGSTRNHPLSTEEAEAIGGPYLEFARTWVPEPLATSSRARVEAEDVAIGLVIVKVCTSKSNADGTLPTARIKAIWGRLYQDGEVGRAFDYHRWKAIRDVIEAQGGLEMVDRRYYSGFVADNGRYIKGKAAKWHMAGWLVETLDEIVGSGQRAESTTGSSSDQDRGGTSPGQEEDQAEEQVISMPIQDRGELCWNKKKGTSPTACSFCPRT